MNDLLFSWDIAKDISNQKKHGISFETAALVFRDPLHLLVQDRFEGQEERWQTLGLVGGVIVLLVAHTVHEVGEVKEEVRIISARKATRLERSRYEKS